MASGFDADAPQQVGESRIVSYRIESGADLERENPRLAFLVGDLELLEGAVGFAQPGVNASEIQFGHVALGRTPTGLQAFENFASLVEISDQTIPVTRAPR